MERCHERADRHEQQSVGELAVVLEYQQRVVGAADQGVGIREQPGREAGCHRDARLRRSCRGPGGDRAEQPLREEVHPRAC